MTQESVFRRLSAILAADVVGYSRLIAADELGTLARFRKVRAEIIDPAVERHHGRLVGTAGDSLLVEFTNALAAVECAIACQQALAHANAAEADARQIVFRMGVNLGDVIVADGTIHGDGVNVAARLEKLAPPGGLCISRSVFEQVKGKVAAVMADLGEQQFHNIADPVRAFSVQPSPPGATDASAPPAKAVLSLPDKPSIAVMPFQNMSGDVEQEYFADGVVEEIITALSRIKLLFVIARNSSFAYKGRAVDVKQIGRELGVRYLLEGSVRKAGNRVRITGQLIDATTGAHLWADRFEGTLEDIFDLQDQVTARAVGAIAPRLEQAEIERATGKPTQSLDAYDYYLRGMAGLNQWTREGNHEGLRHFLRAAELDPGFASAYAMAAQCYSQRMAGGWAERTPEEAAAAERLARKAIKLGQDDALALATGGFCLAYLNGDIDAGYQLIERALALNPNLAAAWYWSGWIKIWLGRSESAIEDLTRAMRLNPQSPSAFNMRVAMAAAHFIAGRDSETLSWAEAAIRTRPDTIGALRYLTASYTITGQPEKAARTMARLREIDPDCRISNLGRHVPFRRPEDATRLAGALRQAGMPE